ncbi:glycosyltransferase family 4 protein [Thiolapillus sp.]
MKIILSVYPISEPLAGIGRYTWELATRIRLNKDVSDLKLFRLGRWINNLDELLISNSESKIRKLLTGSVVAVSVYEKISPLLLGSRLGGYDDYIYHSPNFMLPPFSGPKISTFHDLSVFRCPEYHRSAQVRLMEKEIRTALNQADRLIAISEFTKNEIVKLFGYPGDKIAVVPNGVTSDFFPRSIEELNAPLRGFNLKAGRYFLSVATIEPRKNIDSILDAYEILPKSMRMEYPLVLCGGGGWKSGGTLERIKGMMKDGENVRYLGYVEEEYKPLLYAGATAAIFVPFYEGFGLPVLEAIASGTPVIASDIPPLNEVSAGSSHRVLPQDVEGISNLMQEVASPDKNCLRKIALGLDVAQEFSWESTVEKTVSQYRELIGEHEEAGQCM